MATKKRQNVDREFEKFCRIIDAEIGSYLPYSFGFSFRPDDLPQTVSEAWDKFKSWVFIVNEYLISEGQEKLRYVATLEEVPDGKRRFHFHGFLFLRIPFTKEMDWLFGFSEVKVVANGKKNYLEIYFRKEWAHPKRTDHTCFRTNIFSHFTRKEMEHKLKTMNFEHLEDLSLNEPFEYEKEMNLKYFDLIFQEMRRFCKENGLDEFTKEEYMTWFDSVQNVSSGEATKKTENKEEKPEETE